jgi:hypothetical protein
MIELFFTSLLGGVACNVVPSSPKLLRAISAAASSKARRSVSQMGKQEFLTSYRIISFSTHFTFVPFEHRQLKAGGVSGGDYVPHPWPPAPSPRLVVPALGPAAGRGFCRIGLLYQYQNV